MKVLVHNCAGIHTYIFLNRLVHNERSPRARPPYTKTFGTTEIEFVTDSDPVKDPVKGMIVVFSETIALHSVPPIRPRFFLEVSWCKPGGCRRDCVTCGDNLDAPVLYLLDAMDATLESWEHVDNPKEGKPDRMEGPNPTEDNRSLRWPNRKTSVRVDGNPDETPKQTQPKQKTERKTETKQTKVPVPVKMSRDTSEDTSQDKKSDEDVWDAYLYAWMI